MNNKKILALALSAGLVAAGVAPAFADEERPFETKIAEKAGTGEMTDTSLVAVNANDDSLEEVEYQTIDSTAEDFNGTQSATVYAQVGSRYTVTIPKVIVLSGKTKSASYKVDVDGDIAGNQYVKVAPATTVTMKQAGKADVTGAIAQAVTKFYASNNSAELSDAAAVKMHAEEDAIAAGEASGTVTANGLTAGKWSGAFNFDIALVTE